MRERVNELFNNTAIGDIIELVVSSGSSGILARQVTQRTLNVTALYFEKTKIKTLVIKTARRELPKYMNPSTKRLHKCWKQRALLAPLL